MKYCLSILLSLLISVCFGQTPKIFCDYMPLCIEAVKHIEKQIKREHRSIYVKDTLEFLPMWGLDALEDKYDMFELDSLDNLYYFESYSEDCLKTQFQKNFDAYNLIIFSKPYENYLIAELIELDCQYNKKAKNWLRESSICTTYTFELDDSLKIIKVHSQEIIYN